MSNDQQQNMMHSNASADPSAANRDDVDCLDNTILYIKGLWKDCTQGELKDLFKHFGVICNSRVCADGVAFVRFEKGYQSMAAIRAMNNARLKRCPDQLLVQCAFKEQSQRQIRVNDVCAQEIEVSRNNNSSNTTTFTADSSSAHPRANWSTASQPMTTASPAYYPSAPSKP